MKEIKFLNKMEKHIMFLNWKTQHSKDVNFSQIYIQVNAIPIKIPVRYFVDREDYSKIYKESQRNYYS